MKNQPVWIPLSTPSLSERFDLLDGPHGDIMDTSGSQCSNSLPYQDLQWEVHGKSCLRWKWWNHCQPHISIPVVPACPPSSMLGFPAVSLRQGFYNCVRLVLKLKPQALLFGGPPCSSWVFINRATSRRSASRAMGDQKMEHVKLGNSNHGVFEISILLGSCVWG